MGEPLKNNTVPPGIHKYPELPFICNTKTNPLSDYDLLSGDTVCLSLHRHDESERLYVSCGNYGCRAFKHNLKDILAPFCSNKTMKNPFHMRIDRLAKLRKSPFFDYHDYQN